MNTNIFHGPALIYYLVKKKSEKDPSAQVGKTVIQKLFYLLSRQGVGNFDYSLYHYGPYSSQVSSELNFAENIGALSANWVPDRGYFISPVSSRQSLLRYLEEKEKTAIDEVVRKYGNYNAGDLSVITTALFLKENFGINNQSSLIDAVASLKPQYHRDYISSLLVEA
jgi:uncharacterized protein YwgA